MIEERLEKARQLSASRRIRLVIALLATIFVCGLVLFGLSSVDFSAKKDIVAVSAPQGQADTLSASDRETIRTEFKQLFQQYENEFEPRLQSANPELWNRDALLTINDLKKQVMADFSGGEYQSALGNLKILQNKAAKLLDEAEQIFQENLTQAVSYLAKDLYHEAKLHIDKALMVSSQSQVGLELQKKIEKLPVILPLLNEVKVARAENDLEKEADFLRRIVHQAPEREEVAARLKAVTEQLNNKNFDAHIHAAFAAIEKKQVKEARYHYHEAKKVDPGRSELAVLSSRLSALEKSLQVDLALKLAEQAVRRDDWQQAKINFAGAVKDAPGNKAAIDGLSRAEHVLLLQARFDDYLQNPYRLGQPDVRREAERVLTQAKSVENHSFAITRQAEQLGELISQINRHIPVTVTSDNKTSISVRSIGKVGVVTQKIIQLKPGKYIFEGARKGYKSKLVQTIIPYDQDKFSVHIICDEPI